MQHLVQIVRRGGRIQPGPQHPGKHIAVSPVAVGESQQLDQRLGLAQPPRARNRAACDANTEAAQQRYMQRAGTSRHIHTAFACHTWSLRPRLAEPAGHLGDVLDEFEYRLGGVR